MVNCILVNVNCILVDDDSTINILPLNIIKELEIHIYVYI